MITGTESVLANSIMTAINEYRTDKDLPAMTIEEKADILSLWNKISKKIIDHLVSNIQVSTTTSNTVQPGILVQVAIPSGAGATTSPGISSGTGSGTIL